MWLDAAGFRGHIAAVTEEDVEPAETQHETGKQRPEIRWGVVASVVAHIPIIALLILGLPKIEPKPVEDESVKVELVPPPEEKKPEPKPEEKPPEPKPPEEAKKEPPPPPSPPPPAAAQPKTAAQQANPMPTLRPVTEFGDKNSGPAKSLAGNSSQGEAKPATAPPQRDSESEQMPAQAAAKKPQPETPPSKPVPDDVKLPEVATADVSPERNGPSAEVSGDTKTSIEPAKPPAQKPSEEPKAVGKNNDLPNAKTLFSRTADGGSIAQTAIDGLPRKDRVATLCATELGGQLTNGSPRYSPFALPNRPLSSGTVVIADDEAFGTAKGWYHVRFRCEVDEDATKVVSFAHKVDGLIPRSQYAKYRIRD
ncbi:hypothetical protein B5P46_17520 [Rhizobium leguminosarum]|uniref:DUF930 domain-containing protein n=1 Tax=Rhizobium leguminosarum TaxID=384 RepID=A0A4Q1U010_RHILE|nr:DUF930 domain-containing protein [Rhizobium leguminosarum]RXT23748.1 hypothetical protein B5P46_17520 [Rhizobium leguminosarum]